MKKIFTLLVCASAAVSAMAVRPMPQPTELKDFREMKTTVLNEFNPTMTEVKDTPDGMLRVQDGTGKEWMMMMNMVGQAGKDYGLGYQDENTGEITFATMEEFPMYAVTVVLQDNDQKNAYQFAMMWPCVAWMNESLMLEDGSIDWDKAKQVYGSLEAAQAPCKIDEVLEWTKGFFPVLPSYYTYPSLYCRGAKCDGVTGALKPCEITGNGISYQGCSYLTWNSYDADLSEVNMDWSMAFGQQNQTTGAVTVSKNVAIGGLSGSPVMMGFSNQVISFDELHVFNCGLTDQESYYGFCYDKAFEPVNRYYLLWCDITRSFMGRTQDGTDVFGWNAPYAEGGELHKAMPIAPRVNGTTNYTWFAAALFTDVDEPLEGKWYMTEPDIKEELTNNGYVITAWNSVPTPHVLVPNYEYGCAEQDGFQGYINMWYATPMPEYTYIGFGDATVGFNFKYSRPGWQGYSILGNSTAPYYLHSDPNNWDEFTQAPTIGKADANVLGVEFNSAVEVVESNAPVVSTQYFNLQGQRLNVAPQQGVFIQREIKADGTVKATKIAK